MDGSPLRFKKLCDTEFNNGLLIDFLNQVLNQRERIQDPTHLNTETREELKLTVRLSLTSARFLFDFYFLLLYPPGSTTYSLLP